MTSVTFPGVNYGFQVGINNGPIHLPSAAPILEGPEPPPEPLSTVPFPHDPDFVSRDALLDQIHEKSSVPGSRIVLVGLGGVGKTQLAIEYCYRVRRQSPETWTFWIHASNAARCEKSLRDLADRAKIPGRQDRNANIFQLVGNWLQDETIGKWIFVLDNIDDDELLRKPLTTGTESHANGPSNASMQPPLRYLLESSNGTIIVTSRDKGVALDIAGHKNVIEVQPMNKIEALDLLQKKLRPPAEHENMVQLAEALDFMPLAIVQAAGYINHHSPRCSISQYLENIQKSGREAVRLLDYEAGLLYRDWEAKNSILLTWQISFDYIQKLRPSAADLLSLMSFFDRQGIPESVLRVQSQKIGWQRNFQQLMDRFIKKNKDHTSDSDVSQRFEDDIRTLRNYSLISIVGHSTVLTMHRLVQLTIRTWLKSHGQLEQWKSRFINNLYSEFPTGRYENWERCRSLFPHVKSAVSQRPESEASLRQWTTLLYRGAWYAQESGNIEESREMASMSKKYRLKIFGAEAKETLDSTAMLAVAYRLEGRWEEAEQLQVYVMETSKAKLGKDHPDTMTSMANLASTYRKRGRWEEAEQLDLQAMEARKAKLSKDHPDTLTSMNNLALIYKHQGRLEEAEQLFVQVIETSKTKVGEDHPDTLASIDNLASTYLNQGRWDEAEELEVQVMKTHKIKLGDDHPDTLTSLNNLALIYKDQGRLDEAEQLFVQVIEARKTKPGRDHPDTLTSMGNLASTYMNQGRWGEAEQLQVQVMETLKIKLGEEHPDTMTSMANLASTYRKRGRWEEAEQLEVQVMVTRKTKLGEDHPNTLTSMNNLALIYKDQGRLDEAEQLFVLVIETSKTKLGVDHPSTLTSIANLASTYSKRGRWEEAEQLEVEVMETRKTKLGKDHPSTLVSMANLAFTWESIGQHAKAIDLLRTCVVKQQRVLGPAHPHTVSNDNTLLEWETADLAIEA